MRYAEDILGHTADTRRNYKGTYNNFRTYLQSFPPNEFIHRIFDIEGWVGWNRRRGIGDITLNTYWRQLRPFFRYLEQIDGIQNPYQFIKPPRVTSVLPKARSFEECKHILLSAEQYSWATVYERWRAVAIVGVLLYAGLRRREVLGLRAQDINVRSSTITVLFGKGGKQRTVYMAPELRDIIVRYIHEREYRRYAGPGFFAAMDTGQPISLSTFRRIVNVVRRASGIKFSVHSLRHSFITMALRNGVPIHVVRDLAGHSSIVTTAGYLRVFDSDKQREIRKLSFL
ncbi:MAG TPA: site-specific integrase [Thermoanaerobaculia bacterium]|nr:site-specific integrase [Thermoanaerobaculia bacterium]